MVNNPKSYFVVLSTLLWHSIKFKASSKIPQEASKIMIYKFDGELPSRFSLQVAKENFTSVYSKCESIWLLTSRAQLKRCAKLSSNYSVLSHKLEKPIFRNRKWNFFDDMGEEKLALSQSPVSHLPSGGSPIGHGPKPQERIDSGRANTSQSVSLTTWSPTSSDSHDTRRSDVAWIPHVAEH